MAYDVVSLYPTVNALDDYTVDFARQVTKTPKDALIGSFFGAAEVDITAPNNLHVPVPAANSEGRLLFHVRPLEKKTYPSIDLSFRKGLRNNKNIRSI